MPETDELEALKQKKLAELRAQAEQRQAVEQRQTEAESKLESVAKALLEEPARTRLFNVKLVNKELYLKALQTVVVLAQQGRIREKVSEQDLKSLLMQLNDKKEIKIKRK
ncbi:MAG TPA: hypothetical protein HA252_06610 [Candidatus Diapherotrites archaeon]|uniref:DNA-binding protein n=1 Tax=Candidatus Iainarchaeum sp. TaxID=3101447 RepID=A0A7J4JKC2_9ARCH|nr:hypothetical protein [Candidatus Diapherotrites archaeon]HIH17049.1 hypothetical protein [Candidatus Diapherotrites archaeon]